MQSVYTKTADVEYIQWIMFHDDSKGGISFSIVRLVAENALNRFCTFSDLDGLTTHFRSFPQAVGYWKDVPFLFQCLRTLRHRADFVFGFKSTAELRLTDTIFSLIFARSQNLTGPVPQRFTWIAEARKTLKKVNTQSTVDTSPSYTLNVVQKVSHWKRHLLAEHHYFKYSAFQSPPAEALVNLPDPRLL